MSPPPSCDGVPSQTGAEQVGWHDARTQRAAWMQLSVNVAADCVYFRGRLRAVEIGALGAQ